MKKIQKGIWETQSGYLVIARVWNKGKREKTVLFSDFKSKRESLEEAEKTLLSFKRELRASTPAIKTGSLTVTPKSSTFESVARDRIAKHGDASMAGYFDRLIALCGSKRPEEWREAYYLTIQRLRTVPSPRTGQPVSESTINRYQSVFRMIFVHALDERIISEMPVKITTTEEEGRDRVWTPGEKEKIFKAMEELNSWLYLPVYFSAVNPIRASDLFGNEDDGNPGLRRSDWKPESNWVQFLASKTGRGKRAKKRPTFLKQIDERIRDHFESLPESCDHLFPRILPDGSCRPVIVGDSLREYDREWERICDKAEVTDLRWHDLKHCAITFLLDNGYSELDLKNCGIQYSKKMIDRYYHFDAAKAPVIQGYGRPGLKLLERQA